MRRRDLLAGLGAIVGTGLAGCAGYWEEDVASEGPWVTESGPGPVERQSIRFHESRRNRRVRRVRVAWDGAASAVHVTGLMQYGSSTCSRPGIQTVRYDGDADRLFVRLAPTERDGVDTCSMDLASDVYRATIAFAGSLPATVHVESAKTYQGRRLGGDPSTVERTVRRAEQRELCTTDHPEGSDAAERAHWTCPEQYVRAAESHPERTPTATPEG